MLRTLPSKLAKLFHCIPENIPEIIETVKHCLQNPQALLYCFFLNKRYEYSIIVH